MVDLLEKWLLRFIKSTAITKPVWKTEYNDSDNWKIDNEMIVGTRTEQALVKVSVQARAHFYKRARQCMLVITKKLLQYLPWENIILRASRLLSPSYRSSTMFPKWLKQAALSLPTVISSEQIDQLLLEGEQYQLHSQDTADNNAKDILEHWKLTTQSKFPLLQALVRAMLVLPHGNSDVERLFSNLHDIITDKRNSLSSVTVEALAVSRSYMRSHGLECHSFPITPSLLTAIQNSRHAYSIRVAAERKQAEENEAKQRERSLQEELQRQLAESKRLQSIAKRKEDVSISINSVICVNSLWSYKQLQSIAKRIAYISYYVFS
jgi:hypothetical protein